MGDVRPVGVTIGDTSYLVGYTTDPYTVEELRAMPYPKYLRTDHWRDLRRVAIFAAEHQCQRCGCVMQHGLEVHHLTYERRGEELLSDLIVLCPRCHKREHQ